MIEQISRYRLDELSRDQGFTFADHEQLDHAIFLDLEHYIYHKPLALGIFGAAVREGDELVCTQYFLEDRKDLKRLVTAARGYLLSRRDEGYHQVVAFAARNDLMVLHAMFDKFDIDGDLHDLFEVVDLQKVFQREFGAMVGLNALEEFAGIRREGPAISGSTIAKTFASIINDPGYIHRMPVEKRIRLLDYNREDVVNLFFILANWHRISREAVTRLNQARADQRAREQTAPVEAPTNSDSDTDPDREMGQ